MRPSDIDLLLKQTVRAKELMLPYYFWGSPGVGKSSRTRQTSQEIAMMLQGAFHYWDYRAVYKDPTDVRGLLFPTNGVAKYLVPPDLPTKGPGILALDELSAAPPMVQAGLYQLIFDRSIGDYTLPDEVYIVAMSNKSGDRAVVHRMSTALLNRFVHVEYDVNFDDWQEWAVNPEASSNARALALPTPIKRKGVHPIVIAFLHFKPSLLFAFDPERDERSFPTPRTWTMASKILDLVLPEHIQWETIKGAIGEGTAIELKAFMELFGKLPDPMDVLVRGKMIIPDQQDLLYAFAVSIVEHAQAMYIENAVKWAGKLSDEMGTLVVKLLHQKEKQAVATSPAFMKWAQDHHEVLF